VDVDLSAGLGPQGIKYNPSTMVGSINSLDLFIYPVPSSFTARNPHIPLSIDERVNDIMEMIKRKTVIFERDEKLCGA
jgi:hypothetical protein